MIIIIILMRSSKNHLEIDFTLGIQNLNKLNVTIPHLQNY